MDWDNRPDPLVDAPLALLEDPDWQMSFGERSALEGVLVQAQPGLALEIGTHRGGSLRRIAAHSRETHTVDVESLVEDRSEFPGVTFHIGDSREVVPRLLGELAQSGRTVDFVLIDGDHASETVRADLSNVLASPATNRTVILLHDMTIAQARQGAEAVDLDACPKVVYHELDFVPGYVFAQGDLAGQRAGGLGLVVTGERRAPAYSESPAQRRYGRGEAGIELHAEVERLRARLAGMESSRVWRWAAPLRRALDRAAARRGGG